MRSQNLLCPFRLSKVSVPGDCLRVLAHLRLIELGDGAAPKIVVMVKEPYLRLEAGAYYCRSEVLAHVSNFYFLWKEAGRHFAVLVGIHFVLRTDGIDFHTFSLISLQKAHEIIRIGTKVVRSDSTAQHGIIIFHPVRGTPR